LIALCASGELKRIFKCAYSEVILLANIGRLLVVNVKSMSQLNPYRGYAIYKGAFIWSCVIVLVLHTSGFEPAATWLACGLFWAFAGIPGILVCGIAVWLVFCAAVRWI
jgi:hypothetical protein